MGSQAKRAIYEENMMKMATDCFRSLSRRQEKNAYKIHTHTLTYKKRKKIWVQNFILSQDGMWVKSNIPICFMCIYIVIFFPWALIIETSSAIQEMNGKVWQKIGSGHWVYSIVELKLKQMQDYSYIRECKYYHKSRNRRS